MTRARKVLLRLLPAAAFSVILVACSAADADEPRAGSPVDPTAEQVRYAWDRDVRILTWTQAFNAHQAELFYQAAAAAEAERAAAAANAKKAVTRPQGSSGGPSGGTVGGSCGGATNGADRFIQRESRGDPNARNPSGAWGCYQIMPGTWASSCSDLGQHGSASTDAQAACASRLPSSAWAASGPTG